MPIGDVEYELQPHLYKCRHCRFNGKCYTDEVLKHALRPVKYLPWKEVEIQQETVHDTRNPYDSAGDRLQRENSGDFGDIDQRVKENRCVNWRSRYIRRRPPTGEYPERVERLAWEMKSGKRAADDALLFQKILNASFPLASRQIYYFDQRKPRFRYEEKRTFLQGKDAARWRIAWGKLMLNHLSTTVVERIKREVRFLPVEKRFAPIGTLAFLLNVPIEGLRPPEQMAEDILREYGLDMHSLDEQRRKEMRALERAYDAAEVNESLVNSDLPLRVA